MANLSLHSPNETGAIEDVLLNFPASPASVIPLLQKIQERCGYISETDLTRVSRYSRVPLSSVYAVVTFYSQFRLDRPGKHMIRICQGTACHVLGAGEILDHLKERLEIEEGQTTADGWFTLESVRCLGCCSLAPVIMIGKETFGRLTRKDLDEILAAYREKGKVA
ncbi:MAG TPA: NADH-quinone oxidoreductase subunit NuoE [Candidatus Heimdallarchaeota archaeon]|nr:NADH-quinone oxidoreductase subunit NuoE [Candidatus Heimdallarchaeota archaeon]